MTLLLLFFMPLWGNPPTSYNLNGKGVLLLSLDRNFLELDKVRAQLDSGLTTTLAFSLRARAANGASLVGSCRVDIRYEPWDRVYFVTLWNVYGNVQKIQLNSFDALVAWFADAPITLTRIDTKSVWNLETTIDILPFSQSEAERTQRWFHEHLGNQSSEKNDPNKVLDLLVTSSIRRKSLIRYTYKTEFRSW